MEFLEHLIANNSAEQLSKLNIDEKHAKELVLLAVKQSKVNLLTLLLQKLKLDINFGNSHDGEINPLLYAISVSDSEIGDILLVHGADVNVVTPHGTNSVHYALEKKGWSLATRLVLAGATPDTEKFPAIVYALPGGDNFGICMNLIQLYRLKLGKYREVKLSEENHLRLGTINKELKELLAKVDTNRGADREMKCQLTELILESVNIRYA